jgi:O-antigen ligase
MNGSAATLFTPVLSENRWTHSARLLLIVLLMALPLAFGSVQPWAWAALIVCTFFTTLLWTAGCVTARQLSVSWTPLYFPLLLLLLVIVVQRIWNVTFDPISARESGVKLLAYVILFFLSRELFGRASQRAWSGLGLAVTIYVFAVALFATIQFFSSPGLLYWTKRPLWGGIVFGPYVNHNHYAGLMEILIPLAVGYVISIRRGSAQPVLVFAVLVPIASVLLSGSRGGMISLVGEFAIFAIVLLRRNANYRRRRAAIVTGLGLCAAILLLFLWLDPGDVTKRLEQTATSPELSVADRKQYTADSINMFRDYPLLGLGVGSFEAAYPVYQSFSSDQTVNHAHNDYVEALAETGVIGCFLVLSAVALFLRSVFFEGQRSRLDANWIGIGAAVACCGLLIHSFSDFNLHIPSNAAWFAFAAGIATSSRRNVTEMIGQ